MKRLFSTLAPLVSGLVFALGLGISGMTQPAKVVGFLDFTGAWDPSLAFVMLGAIGVHFLAYRLLPRLSSPIFGGRFSLPTRRDLDGRLLGGAALFGLGWGLGGFCPGPALTSLVTGAREPLLFTGGLLAGMTLFHLLEQRAQARLAAAPPPAPVEAEERARSRAA